MHQPYRDQVFRWPFHRDERICQKVGIQKVSFSTKVRHKKTLFTTLLTPDGNKEANAGNSVVDSEITIDALFN